MSGNDNNIVPLGAHIDMDDIRGTPPVPEIVHLLRATLAEAERGEIVGCAVVAVTGSGQLVNRYHASCNATAMLAAGTLMYETIKDMWMDNALQSYSDETPPPPAS